MDDFDYKFLDPVPEKLTCSICTDILRDPHLTGCCGQHFCHACLRSWFKKHKIKTCPHCRTRSFSHILDKSVTREINQLKVRCSHDKEGCKWVGELSNLQSHLNSEEGCDYELVSCPNKCRSHRTTSRWMKRKELRVHLRTTCYLRKHKCEYCGHEDTYQNVIFRHHSTCRATPLDCPNRCGVTTLKHKDVAIHRKKCPLEPVRCPNGCSVLPRCFLKDHLQNSCLLRRYRCEHCGHRDTYQNVTRHHYQKCPRYRVECPNHCGADFQKSDEIMIYPHMLFDCPLQSVSCPLCTVDYTRKELNEAHLPTHGFEFFLLVCIMARTKISRSYVLHLLTWYIRYSLKVYQVRRSFAFGLCAVIGIVLWLLGYGVLAGCGGILIGLVLFYSYFLIYLFFRYALSSHSLNLRILY